MSAAAPFSRTLDAPGKIFWIGEYAVLEGAPSVVAAVDRYVRITAEPAEVAYFDAGTERLVLSDSTGLFARAEVPPGLELVGTVAATLARAGVRVARVRVTADSSALAAEAKLGLGSSGAVAAGLVAALAPALPRDEALELALQNGHLPVLKVLLQQSIVDVNGITKRGSSLLHLAAEIGDEERVTFLVSMQEDDATVVWGVEREGHDWAIAALPDSGALSGL